MPPRTRSNKMGETYLEGVERGVGTSNPKPEGDLVGMMSQMMANPKHEMREMDARNEARLKEVEIRMQATQNTLFEEITVLKGSRPSRPPTPRDDPIPNLVPEENIGEGGYKGWYSEDEEEGVEEGKMVSPDLNIGFSSGEEEEEEVKTLVVLRMLNVQPNLEEHKEQRCNIFHMKCKVGAKTCLVIIDGGSCANVVSDQLVAKLGLKPIKHPNPYKLQWLGDAEEIKVKSQCRVPLKIGEFEDEVLCA